MSQGKLDPAWRHLPLLGVWKGTPPRFLVILVQVIPKERHAFSNEAGVLIGPASVEHCRPSCAHFDWQVSPAEMYANLVSPPVVDDVVVVVIDDVVPPVVDGAIVVAVDVVAPPGVVVARM